MPVTTQKLRQQPGRYASITVLLPVCRRDFLRCDFVSGVTIWA